MSEVKCPECGSENVYSIVGGIYKMQCRDCKHVFRRDDDVEYPAHYTEGQHEVIDIIRAILTEEEYIGFLKGNVIKYACRAGLKGDRKVDVAKRDKYMDFLIKRQAIYNVSRLDGLPDKKEWNA